MKKSDTLIVIRYLLMYYVYYYIFYTLITNHYNVSGVSDSS